MCLTPCCCNTGISKIGINKVHQSIYIYSIYNYKQVTHDMQYKIMTTLYIEHFPTECKLYS